MNIWIVLAAAGLLLTLLGRIVSWYMEKDRARRAGDQSLGDKDGFLESVSNWVPLVLAREGTMRDVKRLANRARLVTTGEDADGIMAQIVGIVALEELGCSYALGEDLDFEQWKQELSQRLQANLREESILDSWRRDTTIAHWMSYQNMMTGGRIQNHLKGSSLKGALLNEADLERAQLMRADLTSAHLACADLGSANLNYANLTRADLKGANLTEADLAGATLTGADLSFAALTQANLRNAILAHCVFLDTDLREADLRGAILHGALKMTQEQLDVACGDGSPLRVPDGLSWRPRVCVRPGAGLSGIGRSGWNLEGTNLRNVDLSRTDLSRSKLRNANLGGADLSGANLKKADLRGAVLFGVNLSSADVSETNVSRGNLAGASLTNAKLTDANLTDADLTNAKLTDANLTDADLTRANLSGVVGITQQQLDSACGSSSPLNLPENVSWSSDTKRGR